MSPPTADLPALVVWTMTISLGVISFLIRFLPIALLARFEMPHWLKRALIYVPPAVMPAIIAPALFFPGGAPTILLDTPRLAAAALASLVAWRTRSVLWTVVVGMGALWALQALVR